MGMQIKKQQLEPDEEQWADSKLEKSMSGLYIVTLLILLIWRVHLVKCQAGIKIPRRNVNKLRYADDTTFMAESEEEVKSLLMNVKEESEKSWFKTQHSKN